MNNLDEDFAFKNPTNPLPKNIYSMVEAFNGERMICSVCG
jgi:hypothetical protein